MGGIVSLVCRWYPVWVKRNFFRSPLGKIMQYNWYLDKDGPGERFAWLL